jgi:PAS domain S-box-containing protein
MTMMLLVSGAVLLLTCVAFFVSEFLTFRQATVRQLSTVGEIIAANSSAALAFENHDDATEVLSALKAERHVVAAVLYDKDGKVFAKYPADMPDNALPAAPEKRGYHFQHLSLIGFQPVAQGERHLGALYLKLDTGAIMQGWLQVFFGLGVLVIAISLGVAYLLSRLLQQQISQPILALAGTAKAISDRRDYSVRATKLGEDELGLLTNAFNQMLTQIQEQNRALSESEARVRAVLDSAISAVVVIDATGTITDWNARAEQMFGWTRRESLGQKLAETIIPPQYREAHQRGMEYFLATGKGPVLNRVIELSALRRDGSEFPVELSISPLKSGGVTTFCGFITDITERKEAEGKLQAQLTRLELLSRITTAVGERQDLPSIFQVVVRSLEDHLPLDFSCACLHDQTDNVLTVISVGLRSAALATELAMTDQARIDIDQNGLSRCLLGQLVHEPDISQVKFPFPQRLARGGLRSLVAAPLLVESKVFGVLLAARRQPRSFSSGECEFLRQVSGHVALASHQAQLYSALQQAYDDLRQTQQAAMQQERLRALGQMASGIAHDINNAMSPAALYIDSLLEKEPNLSERTRGYLETVGHAIDDVAATVARMREFYRQREPQLMLTPMNLNPLAQQVVNLTRARWSDMPQQRGAVITMLTELAPDLPVIMGVESEIREALTNLIFNAVDAMPEGGTLTLRTGVGESAPDPEESLGVQHVYVEVQDTGVGMDEDTRRRCLEPFFTTKGERGTGLGLAMVYGIIQRHSANIEIESAVGKGTTVRLGFPVPVTSDGEPARSPAKSVVPTRLRILVVDDDPLLIKSLRDALEMEGHAVVTTNGGQAGIDVFRAARESSEPFAVVITDLGMPYVDGRKVASAVKGMSPSTPVILLTGWGQRLVAEGDVPPDVDRVLNKPPKLRDLREALAQCCQPEQS